MNLLAAIIGSIPSPSGNGFSIGPLDLRAYGLMIAFGVIAGVWLLGRQMEHRGIGTADDASSIGMWGVGAGIVGARLYHVATDWDRFSDNLAAIPKIWEGGLGIPGGLLAGIAMGAWQARQRRHPAGDVADVRRPGDPVGAGDRPLGQLVQPRAVRQADRPAVGARDRRQPPARRLRLGHHVPSRRSSTNHCGTSASSGCCSGSIASCRLGPGRLLAVYVMGYGVGRYWVEGLRIDPSRDVGGLRWNQWVALAAIVGGALYLLATRGKRWPEEVGAEAAADSTGWRRHR